MSEYTTEGLAYGDERDCPEESYNTQEHGEQPPARTCSRCQHPKPLSEFYRDSRAKGGYRSSCKSCFDAVTAIYATGPGKEVRRQRYRRNLAERPDEYRARINNQHMKHKAYYAQLRREYRLRFPERYKANNILGRAIRNGKVVRPLACTKCGIACSRVEGHHTDYSKPLDVVWLCKKCHVQADIERDNGKSTRA